MYRVISNDGFLGLPVGRTCGTMPLPEKEANALYLKEKFVVEGMKFFCPNIFVHVEDDDGNVMVSA